MKIKYYILLAVCMLSAQTKAALTDAPANPPVEMTEEDYKNHLDFAANAKLNMNSRWKSLIKAADYAGEGQINDFKKFAQDKDWYMRNASLVALNKISPEAAQEEARRLVTDKALVVRSAAVEVLARKMSAANKKLLVTEVDKDYNYHKKNSLWIRRQILEKIARVATSDDRGLFAKNLFDKDPKISRVSAKALEKITGKKLPGKKFVENWREHAKQNNWL